jgi:hypothetical protein
MSSARNCPDGRTTTGTPFLLTIDQRERPVGTPDVLIAL